LFSGRSGMQIRKTGRMALFKPSHVLEDWVVGLSKVLRIKHDCDRPGFPDHLEGAFHNRPGQSKGCMHLT